MKILSISIFFMSRCISATLHAVGSLEDKCVNASGGTADIYQHGAVFKCKNDDILRLLKENYGIKHGCADVPKWCKWVTRTNITAMDVLKSNETVLQLQIQRSHESSPLESEYTFECIAGSDSIVVSYSSRPDKHSVTSFCAAFLGGSFVGTAVDISLSTLPAVMGEQTNSIYPFLPAVMGESVLSKFEKLI